MFYQFLQTPLGEIILIEENNALQRLSFVSKDNPKEKIIKNLYQGKSEKTKVLRQCMEELNEYFAGKRRNFDLQISPKGTPFQMKIWNYLQEIPFGKTLSYSDIALQMGNFNYSRAVGNANNKNPIPIIIPCHRVIGKDGSLVGYASGLEIKQWLLEFEKNQKL